MNSAGALNPAESVDPGQNSIADLLTLNSHAAKKSLSDWQSQPEGGISAPIAAAFRQLYPQYRISDLPLCTENGAEETPFRFNRVKYLYTAPALRPAAGDEGLPAVIEVAVSPIGVANAYIFPAIRNTGRGDEESPRIVLTNGLIDDLNTKGELAFVLGHEIGHLTSGHIPHSLSGFVFSAEQQERIARIERQWEFEADRFAADILSRRGFSPDPVKEALTVLAAKEHGEESGSHPKIEERLENLGFSILPASSEHQNEASRQTAEVLVLKQQISAEEVSQ